MSQLLLLEQYVTFGDTCRNLGPHACLILSCFAEVIENCASYVPFRLKVPSVAGARWFHDNDFVAASDRPAFGKGKLWQHSLSLTAPPVMKRAKQIESKRMPPGG